jgi:hypothetical protein
MQLQYRVVVQLVRDIELMYLAKDSPSLDSAPSHGRGRLRLDAGHEALEPPTAGSQTRILQGLDLPYLLEQLPDVR